MERTEYHNQYWNILKETRHQLILTSQELLSMEEFRNANFDTNESMLYYSDNLENALNKPTKTNITTACEDVESALNNRMLHTPTNGRVILRIDRTPPEEYITEPTATRINEKIIEFKSSEKLDECIVATAFRTYNKNTIVDIASKSIILNNRYSAGLNDNFSEKEHIAIDVINISKIIKDGFRIKEDPAVGIERLCNSASNLNVEGRIIHKNNAYSFLSKYYYWLHFTRESNLEIPIYDSYTRGMIYWLNRNFNYIEEFKPQDIKRYEDFERIYLDITNEINNRLTTTYSTRDFDMYFWKAGKDYVSDILNEDFRNALN